MIPLDWPLWIVLIFLFLYGATLGSFLNVCIYRIPQTDRFLLAIRGLWSPPSHCPRCFHRIPSYDNIPIIGWLKLGGRCRFCRAKISMRYPAIELFNGLLFVLVYWMEVPSGFSATISQSCLATEYLPQGIHGSFWFSPVAVLNWRYVYHMVLFEALIVATFIDWDLRIIPDGATLPAMLVGLVGAGTLGHVSLVPLWFQDPSIARSVRLVLPDWLHCLVSSSKVPAWIATFPHLHGLLVSVAGLIVGGGAIWGVRLIGHRVLRQEAMGFGDVILMAMIGSFLGWQPTLVVFFVAPLCAMVMVILTWLFARRRVVPYGPYLSLATLIVVLGWKHFWPIAERVFSLGVLLVPVAVFMAAMLFLTLQLIQVIKRLLGIPLYYEEQSEEWTSADHLFHFAGETVDMQQGQWRREEWPGTMAGRGQRYLDLWQNGNTQRR